MTDRSQVSSPQVMRLTEAAADRIRQLAMEQPGSGNLVFVALGRSLGLVAK